MITFFFQTTRWSIFKLVSYITHNTVQLPADSGADEALALSPSKESDAAEL